MPRQEDGGTIGDLSTRSAAILNAFFAPYLTPGAALPKPPAPSNPIGVQGGSTDVESSDGMTTDEAGGMPVTFALWDQCARMIGPDGGGYSNALELRNRLRDRHQLIMGQLHARFDRHHCALLVHRIINIEATRYDDGRRLADSRGLNTQREHEWSWERVEDEDGDRFVLSLGASVDIEGCPAASRTFAGSLTWGEARERTEQLFADRAEDLDREAELLDYRIEVLDVVLFQFETFGYVPLFGGAAGEFEGVSAAAAAAVTTASEERQREQHRLFIAEARTVIQSGTARESCTSVWNQVDTNLNGRPGIDWAEGRARKYARALPSLIRDRRRGQGETTGSDTAEDYVWFKSRVLHLYDEWIAGGRSPELPSSRERSV